MVNAPPPDHPPDAKSEHHQEAAAPCCASCAGKASASEPPGERYVFAVGRLDVRFPNLGLEREFQRAAQRTTAGGKRGGGEAGARGERLARVLREQRHIAMRVCPLLKVGGVPAYVVAPAAAYVRDSLIAALPTIDTPDHWVVVSGRLGPLCRPSDCGGVVAPMLACEELYAFSTEAWASDLTGALKPAIDAKRVTGEAVTTAAQDLFATVIASAENTGATDAHRALNFALVRHPGLFLAVAERSGRAVLDKIETRLLPGLSGRRQVAIVLTFVDSTTGVPERQFSRIDVTDQWPFVAGGADGGKGPLGFLPFVENEVVGALL